jgi:membrane protein required for colicin V production
MTGIDIVILVIMILALIRGFIKGFVMQLAALVALLLGIYISIHFSAYLGDILATKISLEPGIIRWLAFAILFALVILAVHFTGKLVEKLLKITMLSFLNRLTGALFAGIKTIFILAVLITFVNIVNQRVHFFSAEKTEKSVFYKPLSNLIPLLFPRFFHNPEQPVKTEEIVVDLENSFIIKGKYYLCENLIHDLG